MKSKLESLSILAIFVVVLFFAAPIQATMLINRPDQLADSWLTKVPVLRQLTLARQNLSSFLSKHLVGVVRNSGYYLHSTKIWERYDNAERGIIPEDALMVWGSLGGFYYLPDLAVIDYYGLTDHTVARNPVSYGNDKRRMTHDRRPPIEYIKERAPNFRVFPPADSLEDAFAVATYTVEVGPGLWMPFRAVNGLWARERFSQHNFHSKAPPLQTISIHYDRGLALEGYVLWQDKLTPGTLLSLDKPLRMATRWRAAPGLTEDYSLSLRLYDADGQKVFQHDEVIRHPTLTTTETTPNTTSAWPPDQSVDYMSRAEAPDIEAGEYEVRLVVYDYKTGTVSAELDTWRTEIPLTNVRLNR